MTNAEACQPAPRCTKVHPGRWQGRVEDRGRRFCSWIAAEDRTNTLVPTCRKGQVPGNDPWRKQCAPLDRGRRDLTQRHVLYNRTTHIHMHGKHAMIGRDPYDTYVINTSRAFSMRADPIMFFKRGESINRKWEVLHIRA